MCFQKCLPKYTKNYFDISFLKHTFPEYLFNTFNSVPDSHILNTLSLQIRNTARYLLGNLFDFDATTDLQPHSDLLPLDQYLLHYLFQYGEEITQAYEKYQFDQVTQKSIDLVNNKISAFYFDTVKDR